MTIAVAATGVDRIDLRRAPLAAVHAVDFRDPGRDFWADDAALWDRFGAVWAGLDDAAWRLPGAAPSDAGGPDWSLLDHVAHVADWQEIALEYVGRALASGRWPSDDDFDGGDFDTFNERRRGLYEALPAAAIRARLGDGHARLVELARALPMAVIRGDAAWGWVHNVLHGHRLDHLRVLEPWADALRVRQVGNDPFGPDPQPGGPDLRPAIARFWADEAAVFAVFDELVRPLPAVAWQRPGATPGWSVADHVGHLARWFEEGAAALEEHGRTGRWAETPAEGLDAWNERQAAILRGTPADALLARFDAGRLRLRAAVAAMSDAEWRDPEGFSWAYEDLHGHVRAHLAMIGPWAVRSGWPAARAADDRLPGAARAAGARDA